MQKAIHPEAQPAEKSGTTDKRSDHAAKMLYESQAHAKISSQNLKDATPLWGEAQATTADKHLPAIKLRTEPLARGEGPYQAMRRSGMGIEDALRDSRNLVKLMGRDGRVFKENDQFQKNSDGSVAIVSTNKDKTTIETTYGAHQEGKVKSLITRPDGHYVETSYEHNHPTKIVEHTPAKNGSPQSTKETTLDPVSKKPIKSVEVIGDPKGSHTVITKTDIQGKPTVTTKTVDEHGSVSTTHHDDGTAQQNKDRKDAGDDTSVTKAAAHVAESLLAIDKKTHANGGRDGKSGPSVDAPPKVEGALASPVSDARRLDEIKHQHGEMQGVIDKFHAASNWYRRGDLYQNLNKEDIKYILDPVNKVAVTDAEKRTIKMMSDNFEKLQHSQSDPQIYWSDLDRWRDNQAAEIGKRNGK